MSYLFNYVPSAATTISFNGGPVTNPNFSNTTPAAPAGNVNITWQVSGSNVSGYVPLSPATKVAIASNWLNSYDATTGLFTATQPTFADLSAHPTTLGGYGITDAIPTSVMTTLGDMIYENVTPAPIRLAGNITTTKMYLSQTGTGAVSAAPAWAQVAAGDLTNIAGGTVLGNPTTGAAAPSATIAPVLGIPGTSTGSIAIASATASGTYTITAPANAATPTLTLPTTSNVLAGQFAGDGVIFNSALNVASAAGTLTPTLIAQTANFVLAGPTSAGPTAPTFRALVAADIPAITVPWSSLTNAAGALTLANAGFATTFNQTSAVNWTWANTTAATATAAGAPSPLLNLSGTYFTLGASAVDTWSVQNVPAAPKTSSAVGNTTETAGSVVTMAVTAGTGTFAVGDVVTFTNLPHFTWLNGQNATLSAGTTGTSLVFTDPTTHGAQTVLNESGGQVTQANPISALVFAHSGSAASTIQVPAGTTAQPSLTFAGTNIGLSASASTLQVEATGGTSNYPAIRLVRGDSTLIAAIQTQTSASINYLQFNAFITPLTVEVEGSISTTVSATAPVVWLGNYGVNLAGLTAGTQTGIQMGNGSAGTNGLTPNLVFNPAYGVTNFIACSILPQVNQAAITGTIGGVQVVTNVATVVFTTALGTAFTTASTTTTVTAGTNTGVNGITPSLTANVNRATVTITNSVETAGSAVTLTVGAHAIVANDYCYISGMTTMTWLNGKVVKITSVVANTSITFPDPTSHGTQGTGADTGTVVTSYIQYAKTTGNVTLGVDTGTVLQQANGVYTALNIAVTETALGGTPNYLINALAGAAGTTQKFFVTNTGNVGLISGATLAWNADSGFSRLGAASLAVGNGTAGDFTGALKLTTLTLAGKVGTYNGVATVAAGVSSMVATSDLTAQSASIAATTIYAVPAAGAGLYRISYVATITTVDSTGFTLGGTTGFQAKYTNNSDSVVKTSNPTTPPVSAVNTTGTSISGVIYANCKASTNLQYLFAITTLTGDGRYDLNIRVEYMG